MTYAVKKQLMGQFYCIRNNKKALLFSLPPVSSSLCVQSSGTAKCSFLKENPSPNNLSLGGVALLVVLARTSYVDSSPVCSWAVGIAGCPGQDQLRRLFSCLPLGGVSLLVVLARTSYVESSPKYLSLDDVALLVVLARSSCVDSFPEYL